MTTIAKVYFFNIYFILNHVYMFVGYVHVNGGGL